MKCEVRGAIILPSIQSSVKIEASLEKVSFARLCILRNAFFPSDFVR